MDANEAKKLVENSSNTNLSKILEAIKERAKAGKKFLELYDIEFSYDHSICDDLVFRTFDYDDKVIAELRQAGFQVEETVEEEKIKAGIWPFRRVVETIRNTFHTVSWN